MDRDYIVVVNDGEHEEEFTEAREAMGYALTIQEDGCEELDGEEITKIEVIERIEGEEQPGIILFDITGDE